MKNSIIKSILTIVSMLGCANAQAQMSAEPFTIESQNGEILQGDRHRFSVPEDRSVIESRMIELSFVRLPATTETPGNPIIYLAGGPGGSAVGAARGPRFAFFKRLREAGDVILFEQRGTGLSKTIEACPTKTMNDLSEPITRALLTERYRKELVRCSDHWRDQGVNITGYTTAESAADLEDLRQVLGADQLDFVAISYGTHLAMAAMRQGLPIGRAVLTGLEGPDQTVKLPVHFDAFLDRVNAALAADERASAVFGDLRAMMRRVHARLDEAPAQVEITDREGASHLIQFDSFAAKLATSFALISDPARIARLPGFYAEMDMGSYQRVGMFLHRALQTQMGALRGMPELMDAASGISKERAALVEAQSQNALLGDAGNFPMPHVSGAINGLDLGPDFRSDFATDIPVLAIMGTMDGRTPLESQAEILPFFTSSRTITVKNGGHNIFEQSEDLQSQIVAYLQNGEVIIDEISLPPIAFAVPE